MSGDDEACTRVCFGQGRAVGARRLGFLDPDKQRNEPEGRSVGASRDRQQAAASEKAGEGKTFRKRVGEIYRLNMEIFYRKYGMSFLMNLLQHLGTIGILAFGTWLFMQGRTEMGTIVAFISGINRMNDPWSDLVNFFRDLTNTVVRYRLIAGARDGKKEGG